VGNVVEFLCRNFRAGEESKFTFDVETEFARPVWFYPGFCGNESWNIRIHAGDFDAVGTPPSTRHRGELAGRD